MYGVLLYITIKSGMEIAQLIKTRLMIFGDKVKTHISHKKSFNIYLFQFDLLHLLIC